MGIDTEELVRAWIEMHHADAKSQTYRDHFWSFTTLSELCETSPKRCWEIIGKIRQADGSDIILANLAAGPLEDLMVKHGIDFIDAVEMLAHGDEQFRKLLGALWQNEIAEDIWVRIKRVAGPSF